VSAPDQTSFGETEERTMLRDTLRRFLSDVYSDEQRNASLAADHGMSMNIWSQLAELGVVHALFGEQVGGLGGHGYDIVTVFEEIGRAGVVEPLLENAVLAGGLIADLGTADQHALLEQVISGNHQLAFAHAEPGSRYDMSRVTTTAKPQGSGFVLNGCKSVVSNGDAAQTLVVSARTADAEDAEHGISLFLVPADAAGLAARGYQRIDGGCASEMELHDLKLPGDALLGSPGEAFAAIEARQCKAIAAVSAEALGAMETAKQLTIEYLKTRTQFGRPIGKFQVLQHRMADMLIEIEQARSAVLNLAAALDKPREERERHASATKNLVGRVGRLVAEECIQMHGGIGMTQEYSLAHYALRLVIVDHEFGDTDHHLERFIAFSQTRGSGRDQ
jgi:alkylation response protein AidB-like acyl-CoA dehydrogenase